MATDLEIIKQQRHTVLQILTALGQTKPAADALNVILQSDSKMTKLTSKVVESINSTLKVSIETLQKEYDSLNEEIIDSKTK